MKIANSTVDLVSQSAVIAQHESKESLRMWVGDRRPDFEGQNPSLPPGRAIADSVHLSQAACQAQPCKQVASAEADLEPEDATKLGIVIRMVEMMTGKKIKLVSPKELSKEMNAAQEQA